MSKYSSSVNNLLHIRQSGNDRFLAIGKDRNSSIINLDDDNIQAQFRVLDNIWTPSINLNNIESTYNSNVINIGSGSTIIQLNPHIGIGTNDPSVSFEINTVDSMKIPKGNTSQRPTNLTSTDKGFIRYNNELDQFEGFGANDKWRSLEGVMDNDQDTYIIAESNLGDNDELQFYTAGDERMIIKSDGKIGIGTSEPNVSLDVSYKTDAIKLPKGDTTARNAIGASGIEDQGLIRYNTELQQFEGYGAGNAWGSLGGVIDIDQDTYIKAETNATDNDELQFYTYSNQRMIIKSDGKIGIGTSTPSVLLDIYDCNEHILKVGYDNIEISRSIIPSNSNVDIGDPENLIRDIYVSDNSLWIGDTHKISHSDGKLKFRKRKTSSIPQVILDLPAYSGSTESQILQAIADYFNDSSLLTVSNIKLRHWFKFYRNQKGADRTISVQEIFRDNREDYEQEVAADSWLSTENNDIYLGDDYSKIGIGTSTPNVSLDVSYRTDAIKLPKGDNLSRNAIGASSLEDQGLIRYNTELQQFEGFGANDKWRSLEGVMDNDQDTYIKAESNATDNDELQFYTAGDERMIIKSDGKIGLNVSDPSHQLHIKGNTRIEGDLIVNGTQRIIDTDTSTTEQFVITNDGTGPALIVNQIGAHPIMDVQDDSNSVFFIENGGNVGVGTITPNEKLHINGNINIVGNIICDSLDTRFADLQEVLTITPGSITNDQLATLVKPDLVSAKAINIDSTATGGLDNSTDDLKIKAQGVNNNHILNGTIDLTQKVTNNLPVANGGTGANTANNARTNLGLAIGTNVQAYSAKLQSIANLAASAAKIPMFSGLTSTTLLDFVDDEEMLGNSATAVPSQRSVKKYVDTLVGFLNIVIYTLHASNLDSNVEPLAPEAEATLTLDADYSIVGAEGTEQYDTFIVDMTADLADTLGVDESSIEITEVSEGSLVVDFVLKPSESDSNFNPSQAIVALKENLENPDIEPNSNSKFLKQATVAVPPEVVAQALDPSKIFVTLENDRAKIINIAKYFKGEFITYELVTNPHDNVLIDSALQQITITGAFRDSVYDIVINANKGPVSKDLIFNVTEPAPFPPTAKDPKKLVLSDNKKQVNLLDKFKGSYLEIFEIDQNPFNNVSLVDSSNMIYEVQGAFRDTSYSIVFKATQNGGDNLSAYWTLNIKELPLIPTKLLPDIDNLLVATGQTITYNLKFVFIGNGLEYGFRTNPYPDNIYISNNVLYITENQRGITYPIEVFGKNLAQTLVWKITLTEDLPPAPTVIGVDSSNFITTDIINYDLTTIFSGINVTYDIEYYYNIGGSIYPPIDSFFIQNKPWARYHSKNWNKYLNRIVDTSGNNRESIELLSGNINIGSNYISGDKDASMKIPMPNTVNWTVCFAVKYNGANKGTIISGEQTILGHWNGYRGFVQLGGQLLTKIESIGNADDWLILCIKTNGTAPNNIRLNGTSIGVQTNEVALDYLYINKDLNSDWILSDFMVWDYEFNASQTLTVSDLFLDHIAGTTNALNNDIQPVELKSIYNNYNFESNIVSISGNNRGTKYDIYVVGINTRDSVKWKLEIGEGAGTRSENISLTKGVHEYNIKHLFNSTDYEPHLTVNNENFYNINGNVLTFYPNYRDLEYGLIINSANEQYIFNIKEETGVAPRSFSDNNFHLIDNRVIENVDVIGANATVDNTIVIESTTFLYFPENMVSSLLLIDNNKYYYINNIVLNGIYQIKCDSNDIKVLDNTLNVKYSSLSNGIAVDNTVVNNLLTDVFSVADASSNPKFVLKYTPYEKVTILNNFVNLVSTVDVNPEFSSGSGSVISGSTYSYSSDNNFSVNFTEQFDNCELLLIDNNKYYYNSNVSLDGNKQFILSSSNVELVGSTFNSGTDGEVIDLTNVNDLITNVFGSDQIISGSSGSSNVSIPLTQEPVVNPVISAIPLTINNIDYKVLTFNETSTVNFPVDTKCDILLVGDNKYTLESGVILNGDYTFELGSTSKIIKTADISYTTELLSISGYGSWDTHNQTAINAGGRLPTRAEIIALLNGDTTNNHLINPSVDPNTKDVWIPVSDYTGAFIEIGDYPYHGYYTLKTPSGTETYYENNVLTTAGTSIASNTIWGNNSAWVPTTNIYYTKDNTPPVYTSGTTDLNTVTELLPISTFGSWNTHNQTAINAGGRLPTRAEIIALLNGDTTNNHLINPSVDPDTKDVWIPVSDYVGAIVEIGDYPHTPPFYKMSTPNGGETYSEGTTGAYGPSYTIDTVLNEDIQWAPKTNIYYTKTAISSDISGTATDYDSSGIVLKYYMVSSGGTTETPGTIDTTNMLVWYKFDDATNIGLDSSGNSNDGTNAGSSVSTSEYKRGTGSLALTNTSYQLPSIQFASETTISFWFQWDLTQTTEDYNKVIDFKTDTNGRFMLYRELNSNYLRFFVSDENNVSSNIELNTVNFSDNIWYLIIITINVVSGEINININNNNIHTGNYLNKVSNSFVYTNNYIGSKFDNTAGYFYGYIDDFRIYDKALTAQEISDIYNDTEPLVGGSSSSTTGTIDTTNMLVWYKFDDATNIGLDSSGNSNDVTDLNNTAVYSNNTISVNQSKLLVNNLKLLNISGIDFSVSYKLKTSETADWFVILETYNFTPYCGFRIFYSTVLGQIVYYTYKNEDGSLSSNYTYSTGIDLRNNEWHNIVFNFKFNSVTNNLYNYNLDLYCNGTLIGTSVLEYFVKANQSVDIHIASNKNTDATSFSLKSGNIDNFRIYNKALTAQEISDIYNDTEPLVGGSSSSTSGTSSPSTIVKTEERAYPPTGKRDFVPTSGSDLSYTKNINSVYGSGDYTVSVSSYDPEYPQYNPIECFNEGDDVAGIWLVNNYTDMVYSGTFNNNSGKLSSLGYEGDWIQIKLPVKIQLTKTKIKQRSAFLPERSPGDFKIFGSNDETTWVELVSKTLVLSDYVSFNYETTDILDNTNTYQYFILIVNKTLSTSPVMNFDEWYIYGKEHSVVNTTNLKLWFLFNDDLVEKISNTTYTLTQGTPNYIAGKFDKGLNITDDSKLNILNHTDIIVEGQTTVSFSFWLNNLDQNVRDQTLLRYRPTNILLRYSSQYETIGTFVIILEGGSMTKVIGNITSWTHFGFIFNGDTWNIYINGIDDTSNWTNNSSTTTLNDGFTNDNNTFGLFYNDANGGMDYFRSSIDDFRIYNKALTAQEISDIYNDTEPLVGGSSSSTTVSSVNTAKNNLVIWYNFENNLDDSSGNNHNATNPGNGISFNTDSKVDNYSLQQSGYTNADKNYVQIPNTFDLYNSWNGNGISISMWFKIDPVTDSSKSWGNTLIQFSEFETDVWPMNRITLAQNGIENKFWLGIHDPLLGDAVRYNTKNVLDGKIDSQWHHIVLSVSSTGVWTLNCDTIDQGEIFTNLIPDVRYVKNTIGTSLFGTDRGTTGLVDDFRIYNKVLTSAEITAIYNNDVTQSVISSTNYTPIQRVFLKYTTIVKTIEPSIVDTIYLHPVNTTPVLIANDEYYVEIKSTNIIYLPKTYENAEILIIGSTKYVKYENVSLNEFAIITINNDQTTISVNNNNYDLTNGTTIDTALTTELNTYNITEHNNIPKVLIKYTTSATTKITSIVFKDQEYLNVLDYATSLQITNNNITYDENNLKISSNVIKDFDNYFTETIQATNEYGTSSLDYNFIKLGYDGVVVPNLENVSKDIYISNTIANIDLREIANGDNYKLIFNPYEFQNNTILIENTLTLTTNGRGIYDILVSIDNKLYVLRIHETEPNIDDDLYTIG